MSLLDNISKSLDPEPVLKRLAQAGADHYIQVRNREDRFRKVLERIGAHPTCSDEIAAMVTEALSE